MPREYRHISQYEKEILKLREEGVLYREIGNKFGFTKEQIEGFFKRYHYKQRKLEAGISLRKKGRPCKNESELPPSIKQLDKLTQIRYEMSSKDRYIKRLEMENELLRDFLSLAERK